MSKNNVQRIKELKEEEEKLINEPGFSQGDADRQSEINEKIDRIEEEKGIDASTIETESQQVIQGETDTGGDVEVRTDTISNPGGGEPLDIVVTGTDDTDPGKSTVEKVQEAAENQGATDFARDVQTFQERTDQATIRPAQQQGISLSGTKKVQRKTQPNQRDQKSQQRRFQSTTNTSLPPKRKAEKVQQQLRQEIINNRPPSTTLPERFANKVEEAGFNLVTETQQEKDIISDTSRDLGLTNIGNDFGALFEAGEGAVKTVKKTQNFQFEEPLKDIEDTGEIVKEEVVDPSLVAFTDLDEAGIVKPSDEIKERTGEIQATAGTTPQDTLGFAGAAAGGAFTTSAEQGSRFVTRSGRLITGDKDLGRAIDVGEGIERIPVGSAILTDAVSKKPGQFAQEEITQETTETVLGLGIPTATVTTTPSNLQTRFKGSVINAGQKTKQTISKTKDAVTDPNALGAGPGAFLPSETPTETAGPKTNPTPGTGTKKTVTVDKRVNALEIDPLQQETIPGSTQTQTNTVSPEGTATAATPTVTDARPQTQATTQSRPQAVTLSRPETVTETLSETPSVSQTTTAAITPSTTSTVSPSATASETPTATNTLTNTATSTPTPTPEFEDDTDLLKEENNTEDKETSTEFLPSVDALLTGRTKKVDEDEVFTGFETRPIDEDIL